MRGGAAVPAATGAARGLCRAGAGLRLPHLAEVAAGAPAAPWLASHPAPWLEIHPENFLANPHARELLLEVAGRCAISVHTVGLSVGSVEGVDREHLARVRRLVDELDAPLVSGHLAWSTHGGVFLNDLLPLPYDDTTLNIVAAHVCEVQDGLGRRYLVENPASYLTFAAESAGGIGAAAMSEAEFLAELASRTGCGLLCDVSNAYLSAANLGYDAYAYIDALPAHAVGELHLGGFTRETGYASAGDPGLAGGRSADASTSGRSRDASARDEVLIDTHAAPIAPEVWDLYAHALRWFGPRPTLIEWDNDLPAFAELAAQAERADAVAAAVWDEAETHAAAG